MARQYEMQIGEVCREGRVVYYTYLFGTTVERHDRDELCRILTRWANRHHSNDYLNDVN